MKLTFFGSVELNDLKMELVRIKLVRVTMTGDEQIEEKMYSFMGHDVHIPLKKCHFLDSVISADRIVVFASADDVNVILDDTFKYVKMAINLSKKLIFCVSKMESIAFSESRYQEIKKKVVSWIINIGYNPLLVPIIPVSGTYNLIQPANTIMPWFKGWTFTNYEASVNIMTLKEHIERFAESTVESDFVTDFNQMKFRLQECERMIQTLKDETKTLKDEIKTLKDQLQEVKNKKKLLKLSE